MDKKIIIFTTFRSFDGGVNDKIQKFFLDSIKKQTYKNWILAVTVFGEKNVEESLKQEGVKYKIYPGKPGPYKFSWSEAFLNGIKASKDEPGENILLWASSDVIFKHDFFQTIIDSYKPRTCGISYPQTSYSSIENFKENKGGKCAWYGFDTVFFSTDIFDEKNIKIIEKYPNNDWLYFEIFLAGVGIAFCDRRINIQPSGFYTITNDYAAVNQTYQSTKNSGLKNMVELKKFAKEFNIPDNSFYEWILRYKITNRSPKVLLTRFRIYLQVKYMSSYIRRAMPKIKRILKLTQ